MCCSDRLRSWEAAIALIVILLPTPVWSQPPAPKLNLKAELVLTPDFCAAEMKRGNRWTSVKEDFPVGAKLCPALEDRMGSLFKSMKKIERAPAVNATNADLVLVPKIGDIGATQHNKRELVIVLEWTALNRDGRTLWVGSVEGIGKGKMGGAFTHEKYMRKINDDAVHDAVEKSVQKIGMAPELMQLAK